MASLREGELCHESFLTALLFIFTNDLLASEKDVTSHYY